MQTLAKNLTLVLITVAGGAFAIDSEPTARPKVANCVQCVPGTPAPKVGQPAPNPAPAQVPGLSASIGSATLVDMKSEQLEPTYFDVHGFEKKLVVKSFPVQVPVQYEVDVPYIVEVTKQVPMTGTYSVTRDNYVPVTQTHTVPYRYCDPCKGWVGGEQTYTTTSLVNRPYQDDVQYGYTKNVAQQEVRSRKESRVRLEEGIDTKVVETVVPKVEKYKKMVARTVMVYETSAITPVLDGQ